MQKITALVNRVDWARLHKCIEPTLRDIGCTNFHCRDDTCCDGSVKFETEGISPENILKLQGAIMDFIPTQTHKRPR